MKRASILTSLFVAGLYFPAATWAQDATAAPTETGTDEEISVAEELGFRQVFGEGMLDAYENKTIEGVYPEYAASVAAGVPPDAFTEFHNDNATTNYAHRSSTGESYTIKGIYTVKKDTICYHYNSPGRVVGTFCFFVFIQDSCYFHYIEADGIPTTAKEFDNWTSMAYAKEDAGTCLPNIS